jgi:hypothetical protein
VVSDAAQELIEELKACFPSQGVMDAFEYSIPSILARFSSCREEFSKTS